MNNIKSLLYIREEQKISTDHSCMRKHLMQMLMTLGEVKSRLKPPPANVIAAEVLMHHMKEHSHHSHGKGGHSHGHKHDHDKKEHSQESKVRKS